MDAPDRTLLDRYLTGGDEAAFALLVHRHLGLVQGVALRVTGNDELARDVAQATFIRLAQRAALVPRHLTLTAWLHRVTRGLAVDAVRAESRRKQRELHSDLLPSPMPASFSPDPDWSALAPVVDELVDQLSAGDRDLLLLRYYGNQSHAAIAARLGLSEGTARQRTLRAMEKLRGLLRKRGIATSAAALATLLPAHAVPASSAQLAATVLRATHGLTPAVPSLFTTFLVAMNASQKIALAGSLLLLLAATGYTLAPDSAAGVWVVSSSAAGPPGWKSAQRGSPARERGIRPAPATAEARLERLKAIMAIASTVDRHAELIAYFDGLPPALFQEATRFLIDQGKDPDAILLAASAWAKVDRPAALAFAKLQPTSGHAAYGMEGQILRDWGAVDPQAALAWIARSATNPVDSANDLLGRVAATTPEEVGKLIRDMPPGEARSNAFRQLIDDIKDHPVLVQRVIAGATESQQAVIYGTLATSVRDPEKSFAILKEHPEAVDFVADPKVIFKIWAGQDRAAATAAVAALPPGKLRDGGVWGLVDDDNQSDHPQAALELMDRYPGAVPQSYLPFLIKNIGAYDRELGLRETVRLSDPDDRAASVIHQLQSWLEKDPAAAQTWLRNHPQPDAILRKLPPEK